MEVIELRDALNWMRDGKPFSLKAVKYDRNRRTGGQIFNITHATLHNQYPELGILRIKTNSGQLREVHKRLIIEFNGKQVIW